MSVFNYLTSREKNLWIELIVDVAVMLYYWPKAFVLLQKNSSPIGIEMASLIISTIAYAIFLAIVVAIVFEVLVRNNKQVDVRDERDALFELRSYRFGFYSLIVFTVLIMGQVVIGELFPMLVERAPFEFTPIFIAHCIFLSINLSSLIQCSSQLFYYRRGY